MVTNSQWYCVTPPPLYSLAGCCTIFSYGHPPFSTPSDYSLSRFCFKSPATRSFSLRVYRCTHIHTYIHIYIYMYMYIASFLSLFPLVYLASSTSRYLPWTPLMVSVSGVSISHSPRFASKPHASVYLLLRLDRSYFSTFPFSAPLAPSPSSPFLFQRRKQRKKRKKEKKWGTYQLWERIIAWTRLRVCRTSWYVCTCVVERVKRLLRVK